MRSPLDLRWLLPSAAVASWAAAASPWVADQGDCTYRNPVLFADWSDPDAVRVGEDYYLTSSTFNQSPGLPILRSRDLVNWTLVAHALPRLDYAPGFERPQHGKGVWAPSLRHHAGKFWLYFPDPDHGIFLTTAVDADGPWTRPVCVIAGRGLIDPCPLWDDDGRVWLVHGWARSRAGIGNRLTLRELSADGSRAIDTDGTVIIDGDKLPGYRTLEGPKFYKRGDTYWIFAPAGGVKEGWQSVFRAKDIRGPYEDRIVLAQGRTPINGPHQGAWVVTPTGEDWFLHFQDREAFGRVVHLQPMRWREDGWPVMGADPDGDGRGEPVLAEKKPVARAGTRVALPPASDDFAGRELGLQWGWEGVPPAGAEWAQVQDGVLRLTALTDATTNLRDLPQVLAQRLPGPAAVVTTSIRFVPRAAGEEAGLIVLGADYAWLGLRQGEGGAELIFAVHREAGPATRERVLWRAPAPAGGAAILRVAIDADARCRFSVRAEGADAFADVGEIFQAMPGRWVGARVGMFARSLAAAAEPGYAEFSEFRVEAPGP
ncbi:MAG TPA: glycoside hydrolase 43 family protein [Opitutaceae bacterium]